MTTEAATYAYNLDNAELAASLADYRREVKGHHTPSVKTVKAIAAYLGHRQRSREKYGIVCVYETLDQIAQATAMKTATVSDALRFMSTRGITKTIKHGGGRNRLPTVRVLVTDAANPEQSSDELTGRTLELTGRTLELTGEPVELTGQLPRTPRVTKSYQTFTKGATPPSSLRAGGVAMKSPDVCDVCGGAQVTDCVSGFVPVGDRTRGRCPQFSKVHH